MLWLPKGELLWLLWICSKEQQRNNRAMQALLTSLQVKFACVNMREQLKTAMLSSWERHAIFFLFFCSAPFMPKGLKHEWCRLQVCPDVSTQETHFALPSSLPRIWWLPWACSFSFPTTTIAVLPFQFNWNPTKARRGGSKASSHRGDNKHIVGQITYEDCLVEIKSFSSSWHDNIGGGDNRWMEGLSSTQWTSIREALQWRARWSESEKRLDRGDIAAKNGCSRVRQCIKEPQGQRRSERIMRPCV